MALHSEGIKTESNKEYRAKAHCLLMKLEMYLMSAIILWCSNSRLGRCEGSAFYCIRSPTPLCTVFTFPLCHVSMPGARKPFTYCPLGAHPHKQICYTPMTNEHAPLQSQGPCRRKSHLVPCSWYSVLKIRPPTWKKVRGMPDFSMPMRTLSEQLEAHL